MLTKFMRPPGYAVEVEIKTSRSDLRAEARKRHTHDSRLFRELWFALPEAIADDLSIPAKAGMLAVETRSGPHGEIWYSMKTVRRGELNRYAIRWPEDMRRKLLELGVMRIWSLKQVIWERKRERKKHVKSL